VTNVAQHAVTAGDPALDHVTPKVVAHLGDTETEIDLELLRLPVGELPVRWMSASLTNASSPACAIVTM
jgi:hypothetical protein